MGILIFVALFIYSSSLYPGGSQANINTEGFDWVYNYWCDLKNKNGMNEKPNPASPVAIAAMMVLCISLMSLFIRFAGNFAKHRFWKKIIMICGTISMIGALLVFTRYHSIMIAVASLFGLFTLVGIIFEVYNSRLTLLKIGGLFCILLLILNNYIYYSRVWVEILPLLQKVTFAIVLLWLLGINFGMKLKKQDPES